MLQGIPQKKLKPKFPPIDVKRKYLDRCIREKYLSGVTSWDKLVELFGVPWTVVRTAVKDLPKTKKRVDPKKRREVWEAYSSGIPYSECMREFSVSKGSMNGILRSGRRGDFDG